MPSYATKHGCWACRRALGGAKQVYSILKTRHAKGGNEA